MPRGVENLPRPVAATWKLLVELGAEPLTLLGIGAEAVVLRCRWMRFDAVAKHRLPKPYRDQRLDKALRESRTVLEARLVGEAKKLGVPTPSLLFVDPELCLILFDYIPGVKLKDILSELECPDVVFNRLGYYTALLHSRGIVHGDLTTSNIIALSGKVYLIDFGLGSFSNELEEQGVDVHLMLRSLESTHPSLSPTLYSAFLRGYEEVRGAAARKAIELKVAEVRRRGRYVAERRKTQVF